MSEIITIATANTHNSRMLHAPNGLMPFREADVDTLLMQEVVDISGEELDERLRQGGYYLAHFFKAAGLAIAAREQSGITPVPNTAQDVVLQRRGRFASVMEGLGVDMRNLLRTRGMTAMRMRSAEGVEFIAASAHPIFFLKARARARQVRALGQALQAEHYGDLPLVLGADMNHYPRPHKVDDEILVGGLRRAKFTEPTWLIQGSRHQWAARFGAGDGQLDSLLHKGGLEPESIQVVGIESDHRAVIGRFVLAAQESQATRAPVSIR